MVIRLAEIVFRYLRADAAFRPVEISGKRCHQSLEGFLSADDATGHGERCDRRKTFLAGARREQYDHTLFVAHGIIIIAARPAVRFTGISGKAEVVECGARIAVLRLVGSL